MMNKNDKACILVVDDKPANVLVLENLLAGDDRIILTASSGKEALSKVINKEVDLIILDVQMPGMDGFEVAGLLKSNVKTRDIPIIFATAEQKGHSSQIKGFGEGAVDYLFKPLDPEIAKAKVKVLLSLQMQKKELQEKNKSLEKSALLIDNSADIIGIVNPSTLLIEEANQALGNILGFSLAEIKDKPLTSLLLEEYHEQVKELVGKKQERFSFETRVYDKNKQLRWLQWRVVLKEGKWFVNARDVSNEKQADEEIRVLNEDLNEKVRQLEEVNKQLESFSYTVSHDLRAPLRAMNGYSQILQEDYGDKLDEEANELLRDISANAKRMGTLIDDLLAFSRLGRQELFKTGVDMNELLKDVLSNFERSSPHKAKIKTHDLPTIQCDQNLIKQVWINLLSNAIKYSAKKEDPRVEIGCERKNDQYRFFVKDNGAGFNMEYADKLFGVFERLHLQREFEGTGVGLAIVHNIVMRHGGRIWAEAKTDEGACFYFELPA